MRISRALAAAAVVLAPAGLVIAQAGTSEATLEPCGAVTWNPSCDRPAPPQASPTVPTFPYGSTAIQFPTGGSCTGAIHKTCGMIGASIAATAPGALAASGESASGGALAAGGEAASGGALAASAAADAAYTSDQIPAAAGAPAPGQSSTLLGDVLPLSAEGTVASANADQSNGLPVAPMAASGTLLGAFGAMYWIRRKRLS